MKKIIAITIIALFVGWGINVAFNEAYAKNNKGNQGNGYGNTGPGNQGNDKDVGNAGGPRNDGDDGGDDKGDKGDSKGDNRGGNDNSSNSGSSNRHGSDNDDKGAVIDERCDSLAGRYLYPEICDEISDSKI